MIIVHAAGNEKIGIGNLVRSYSLALELKKEFNNEVNIIFECSKALEIFVNQYNLKINIFNNRYESKKYISKLKLTNNNIYISDLLDIDRTLENVIRGIGIKKIIHLNDTVRNGFRPDIIIDGDGFKKKWNSANINIVQSPKYHIVKKEIVDNKPEHSWDKCSVRNILVCFGGSDPGKCTEKFLKQILKKKNTLNFKIILGPGFSEERIKNITQTNISNVEFCLNSNKIYKDILESDLIVTLGGGLMYEAMCLGRAVLAIKWKYLGYYVENLEKINLVKMTTLDIIINDLIEISSNTEKVKELSLNGWNTIDGKACKRIINLIKRGKV